MPFRRQIHVDQLLSQISVRYATKDFIADKIFPEVMVKKDSDLFRVYAQNFRIPETRRADKAVAKQHYFEVSTASYLLEDHALKDYISDDQVDNYDQADLRADTTEELTDVILRRREKSVFDLFTTTNWSLNVSLAAGSAFTANTTSSDPVVVFHTGATEIIENSGKKPNFAVMHRTAFIGCVSHTSVLDRVKYTNAEVTEKILAALFMVDDLMIPTSQYDSSHLGVAASHTSIWGDVAFIGFKPSRPSPLVPSCGYIFRKDVPMVRRWRDEERIAEAIEVRMKYQPRVVASLTGFLIKDTH